MAMHAIRLCKANEKTQKHVMSHGNDDHLSLRNDQKAKCLDNSDNCVLVAYIRWHGDDGRVSTFMRMQMEEW